MIATIQFRVEFLLLGLSSEYDFLLGIPLDRAVRKGISLSILRSIILAMG